MPNNNKITPPSPRYLTILCDFMAFFHKKSKPYSKDHEFSEDELAAITPNDIVKWMNIKAFGTPHPGTDAKLVGSSSSLEFMKKAISFYMPNKENWDQADDGDRRGNPTKSREVKALMQRVAALGGVRQKNKKEDGNASSLSSQDVNGMLAEAGDGAQGLLQRMHAQNNHYINILNTMGSALRTFSRSVEQMKMALETNNIAIRNELSNNEAEDGEGDASKEDADEAMADAAAMPDIPSMNTEMKENVAKFADVVEEFSNNNVVTNTDMKILSGADGFCTFNSDKTGKQMDVPEGFNLPSCDLLRAWRHWITGFPDFKMRNDRDEVVDAPIRPLRFVNTGDLPFALKKKFKDGWRPILLSMQGDVAPMLETTPVSAIDERFVRETYGAAMNALFAKAPGIFADAGSDKYGGWKVATWSRKIREQQLGQQQVRRRQELGGVGGSFALLRGEDREMHQQSPMHTEEERAQQLPLRTEEERTQQPLLKNEEEQTQQLPLRTKGDQTQQPSSTTEEQQMQQPPLEDDVQLSSEKLVKTTARAAAASV